MYFGSVRFFRHLIVGLDLLLILGLATATVIFAIKANNAEQVVPANLDITSEVTASDESSTPQSVPIESQNSDDAGEEPDFTYQSLYPEMVSSVLYAPQNHPKTVYLTFDDGPSPYTEQVLEILKENDVKATFFVVGNKINQKGEGILQRMLSEGHAIGVHTYSHVYTDIYSSVESYLDDFSQTYQKIYEVTGQYPDLYRFPGGSVNSYNQTNYQEIIAEMTRRNFIYFDWNVTAADSTLKKSDAIVDYVLTNIGNKSEPVILMHDTKSTAPEALAKIIPALKDKGYQFSVLSKSVEVVSFAYPN